MKISHSTKARAQLWMLTTYHRNYSVVVHGNIRVQKSGNLGKASHKIFTYELPEHKTLQFLYKIQPDPLFRHGMIIIFTINGPTDLNKGVIMLLWL